MNPRLVDALARSSTAFRFDDEALLDRVGREEEAGLVGEDTRDVDGPATEGVGFLVGEGWVLDSDEAVGAAKPPVRRGAVVEDDASEPTSAQYVSTIQYGMERGLRTGRL